MAIARLTALWAFAEAGLGGLLHAARTPFTGLIVGGVAVVLIVLIGYFAKGKGEVIWKSLLMVLIVKALVSPHSPPTAYLAVSFQAATGSLLYALFKHPRMVGPLLGIFAMAESAIQKLLVLTILFGTSFWDALNEFAQFAQGQIGISLSGQGAEWLAAGYVGGYILGGLLIGVWAGKVPRKIDALLASRPLVPAKAATPDILPIPQKRSFRGVGKGLFVIVPLLLILWSFWGDNSSHALPLIGRTLAILVLWYGLLGPFLINVIRRYLLRKERSHTQEVAEMLGMMPHLHRMSVVAWAESRYSASGARLSEFLLRMITYALVLDLSRWDKVDSDLTSS